MKKCNFQTYWLTVERTKLKNYAIFTWIWLLMNLVLSNPFKALLLSSYKNIKLDSPIKSLQDLVDKKSVDIIFNRSFDEIITNQNTRIPEVIQLKKELKECNWLQRNFTIQYYHPHNKSKSHDSIVNWSSYRFM